jgi:hypothetical protein
LEFAPLTPTYTEILIALQMKEYKFRNAGAIILIALQMKEYKFIGMLLYCIYSLE